MMRVGWTVAMVILVCLSGCAGKDKAPPADDVGLVNVDGVQVAADKAVVKGRVFSDAGLVVAGARVFLARTAFDADTGTDGRFQFVNVSAGQATLRVEADGFQVHERELGVPAGTLLEVNVTLLPTQGLGGSYLPHVHDFWRGRSEVTIFDAQIDLREQRVGSTTADRDGTVNYASAAVLYANQRYPWYPVQFPEGLDDGNPPLVYPGAARVEATLTWNDEPPMPPTYAFGYRPADLSDEVLLPAGPSGTTWTMEVGPTQADNGHQRYTMWEFSIVPDNDVASAPDYRPAVVTETVHLTIVVFRGDEPPVEPAHPTFWNGTDTLSVRTFDDGGYVMSVPPVTVFAANPRFLPSEGKLVPPGTARIEVELVWAYEVPTPADVPYVLYYHSALTSPVVDYFVSNWPQATMVEDGPGRRVFEIELQEGEADGYYQQRSAWRFAPRPEGHEPDDITPDQYRERSINVAVVAYLAAGAQVE